MDQSSMQRTNYTAAKQVNRRDYLDEEYDDTWPPRQSTSVRRYYHSDVRTETGRARADVQQQPPVQQGGGYYSSYAGKTSKHAVPARRTATQSGVPVAQPQRKTGTQTAQPSLQPLRKRTPTTTDDFKPRQTTGATQLKKRNQVERSSSHKLVFYLVTALIVMVVGWFAVTTITNWWQVTQDDWHYGRPRTFQTDQVVGHSDSAASPSHFIVLNLKRHIQIVEFPGGDSSKARIYSGPTLIGPGQDLAAVTLSFKDVNHDGKPAMIVNVQDSHFVFINENGTFRPAKPGENV